VTGAKVGVDFLLNAGEDSLDDNLEACCQGPKRLFLFHHLLKAAMPDRSQGVVDLIAMTCQHPAQEKWPERSS